MSTITRSPATVQEAPPRCQWRRDGHGMFFIPACIGGAMEGPRGCTCTDYRLVVHRSREEADQRLQRLDLALYMTQLETRELAQRLEDLAQRLREMEERLETQKQDNAVLHARLKLKVHEGGRR